MIMEIPTRIPIIHPQAVPPIAPKSIPAAIPIMAPSAMQRRPPRYGIRMATIKPANVIANHNQDLVARPVTIAATMICHDRRFRS